MALKGPASKGLRCDWRGRNRPVDAFIGLASYPMNEVHGNAVMASRCASISERVRQTGRISL